jgi:hypothetical protein
MKPLYSKHSVAPIFSNASRLRSLYLRPTNSAEGVFQDSSRNIFRARAKDSHALRDEATIAPVGTFLHEAIRCLTLIVARHSMLIIVERL